MDLQHYLLEGKVLLRDNKIPVRNNSSLLASSSLISDYSNEEFTDNYDTDAVMKVCDQSQSLLDNDSEYRQNNNIQEIQRSLKDMACVLNQSSNNKYQKMIGLAGELNRITEDNEQWHDEGCDIIAGAISKFTKLRVGHRNITIDAKESSRLHFPETGQYNKQKEKRKKTMGK